MSSTSGKTQPERLWRIPRRSDAFDEAKRFAELALDSHPVPCREAAVMAVWELADNVLKYGQTGPEPSAGTIGISIRDEIVRIRASCVAASFQSARTAMETISRIARSSNVSDLYRDRLRELFEHPDQQESKLGLLRVAFEGGFHLSCDYRPPYFEVVAERTCTRTGPAKS